jgi:hypothetical protein
MRALSGAAEMGLVLLRAFRYRQNLAKTVLIHANGYQQ